MIGLILCLFAKLAAGKDKVCSLHQLDSNIIFMFTEFHSIVGIYVRVPHTVVLATCNKPICVE